MRPPGRERCTCHPGRPGWLPTQAPHRPVRAELPHTVPQVTVSLRALDLVTDPRVRQRVTLQEKVEPLPGQVGCSRAATEPLAPSPLGPVVHAAERLRVSGDPVVPVVPPQFAEKLRVLQGHGYVPVPLTPQVELPQESGAPIGGRLALHHPLTPTRFFPEVSETEEVETPWSFVRLHPGRLRLAGPLKAH